MMHLLLWMAFWIVFLGTTTGYGLYWLYEMTAILGEVDPPPADDEQVAA